MVTVEPNGISDASVTGKNGRRLNGALGLINQTPT
jgi:hypothetical protein